MRITFRGACREVGRSCIEVQANDSRILLDAGMKVHDHAEPVKVPEGINAIVLTHAHLDHSGALPTFYKHHEIPTYCTFPTIPLSLLLLLDAEKVAIKRKHTPAFSKKELSNLERNMVPVPYGKESEITESASFQLSDAGHIPGSAIVSFHADEKTLVYTGDYKLTPTKMHSGADLPKQADVLVLESTYSEKEMPDRKKLEKEFVTAVKETIEAGSTALVPCFAVGRVQEILQVLHAGGITDAWVDGMGKTVCSILADYPSYLRDSKAFLNAVKDSNFVESREDRKTIVEHPSVVLTTAGMLDGGPALSYLSQLNKNGNGKVFLTGFQVDGTNGRKLLDAGVVNIEGRPLKITLPTELYNFSAHASRTDLFETVKRLSPEKVFCIHGDEQACMTFAKELNEQGFEAHAPQAGDEFEV